MAALEPIDLPETALIIGDNFPTHDETAYAREAESQRGSALSAGEAGGTALAAAKYTDPQFRGLAGSALGEALSGHHRTLLADEGRHRNVAAWMDLGAENIAQTKKGDERHRRRLSRDVRKPHSRSAGRDLAADPASARERPRGR